MVESPDEEADRTPKTSYGWMNMENDRDKLTVWGNFSARSHNSSIFSAGTLEFMGNVNDYKGNTIRCSGTNKAIFRGNAKKQVVEFESSSASFQTIQTPKFLRDERGHDPGRRRYQ